MTEQRKKWEHDTQRLFKLKVSRLSENNIVEFIESKYSINGYLKDLVKADMDTERLWRICMGVATGAEYAKRYGWEPLHTQLWKLAVELGARLGLDPGEVYRQSHQVQESERLY